MATKNAAKRTTRASKKSARMTMGESAMMAAWQKAMTPSEGHRRLEPMVGSWRAKTTFTMAPGAPAEVSEGTAENRWVLGGRYLEQTYKAAMMGMPFEGIGYTGYDNAQRRYAGTWMDNFGTGFMHSIGKGKPRKDAIDFEATAVEPSGKTRRFLCKIRVRDHDHHVYEMWTNGPGGKPYRTMRVEYTRA